MSDRVDGGSAQMTPGELRVVRVPGGKPPRISVVIAHTPDGPRAYWNVCCHLPIPLDSGLGALPRGFVCASHGARYRPEDGLCVEGPCRGALLDPVEVTEVDGRLLIDVR